MCQECYNTHVCDDEQEEEDHASEEEMPEAEVDAKQLGRARGPWEMKKVSFPAGALVGSGVGSGGSGSTF